MVKYNIQDVNFTPARFNIGDNIEEAWISSSTGPYLVTWNFRKVKERRQFPYKVRSIGVAPTEAALALTFVIAIADQAPCRKRHR